MKRVLMLFLVLTVGLSLGLWFKVRENALQAARPPGGTGVIEGVEIDVGSRLATRITQIHVQEGDRVKTGQLLVELDCREPEALLAAAKARLAAVQGKAGAAQAQVLAALGSAKAAVAGVQATSAQSLALEANRDVTSRQVNRLKQLQGQGGATEQDLDRASSQVTQLNEQLRALKANALVAQNQAAAARASVEAVKRQAEAAVAAITAAQAEVRRAQTLVEECRLKAPLAGHVLTRAYEPGEVLLPGSSVLTLVQLDPVETVFYLPNRDLRYAAPGKAVTVVADTFPGQRFVGRILAVSTSAEFTPRNVQTREDRDRLVYAVRVRLPNPQLRLRPGMPVEVTILNVHHGEAAR
jgi:HlyD family secretion protein